MTTVMVAGAMAGAPRSGGDAWIPLSWIRALEALGFEVLFVEQIGPDALVDVHGRPTSPDDSINVSCFDGIVDAFDLDGRAALVDMCGRWVRGMEHRDLLEWAEATELLVNIGGHLTLEPLRRRIRSRAYVDVDPGFVHFREAGGVTGARLEGHDHYFTIGENIGRSGCLVPTLDLTWHPIRQPVVLEDWAQAPTAKRERFTTVAKWRGPFGPIQFGGRTFGLKIHEFRRFMEFPKRAKGTFEIVLDIRPHGSTDLERLRKHGWIIVDPVAAAGDPESFRAYVQGSGAEFSVVQGIHVDTRSGWFGDRSTRYLASGKPVLVQDTGVTNLFPVGEGLVVFSTMAEARAGARAIQEDYDGHSQAARALARQFFSPEPALTPLLDVTGVSP